MPFTKDITAAPYNATGNGVTNDRAAFLAFRADAQGLDAILTAPSGKTFYIGPRSSPFDSDEDYLFSGIPTFDLDFNGSSITDAGTTNDFHLGARHIFHQDHLLGARIETVSAGADTVTIKTSTDHSRFSVGDLLLAAGFQMQESGFPCNPHFFEFLRVLSKQTTTLPYTITFTSALRNSYKSTWPDWGVTPDGFFDYGPAILYRLDQGVDCVHIYRNLVVNKTGATRKPTNCGGRSITLNNVTPTNEDGINPTCHVLHALVGCDYSAVTMELDKCIEAISMSGCTMNDILVQSSSNDLMQIESSTTINSLTGAPKRLSCSGSSIAAFRPGAQGYGRSDQLDVSNSVLTISDPGGWVYKGGNNSIGDDLGVDNGLNTMSGGVIRIPKSYTAKSISWAVPGTWCCWQDRNRLCIRIFRVIDVTDDATYVYIQTSESGSWPSYDSSGGGHLWIRPHPAPRCTFTNSSESAPAGTDDGSLIYGLTLAPAGAPLWSFARRVFNGETIPNVTHEFGSYLWGALSSLKMTPSPVYSGSVNPAKMQPVDYADWLTLASGSISNYLPAIDIRAGGQRKVEVAGGSASYTGFVVGDANYTLPEVPAWFANFFEANMMHDIRGDSGSFAMTVEVLTDQGIAADVVLPPHGSVTIRKVHHLRSA